MARHFVMVSPGVAIGFAIMQLANSFVVPKACVTTITVIKVISGISVVAA